MYRDDRDAQLARLHALDRENRELRAENRELHRALTEPDPEPSRERDYHAHETLPPPPSSTCLLDRSRDRYGLASYLEDPSIRLGLVLTLVPIVIGILVVLSRQ